MVHMDATVSADRSLTYEFPVSPSSQLMYDSEPFQDQCCAVGSRSSTDQPILETGVISPSVEGLTFNDYDVLSMFVNDPLPVSAPVTGGDDLSSHTDAWKMTDAGPTLTQLNADDLDATLLDDFSVSSASFCVDMSSLDCSQLVAASSVTVPSNFGWTEQQKVAEETPKQRRSNELISQLLRSRQEVRPEATVSRTTHTDTSTSMPVESLFKNSSAFSTQMTLDRNWEAIESFLKSEDKRMAVETLSDQHYHQQHSKLKMSMPIKSEDAGICISMSFTFAFHFFCYLLWP